MSTASGYRCDAGGSMGDVAAISSIHSAHA
jgi:hypothetical protein